MRDATIRRDGLPALETAAAGALSDAAYDATPASPEPRRAGVQRPRAGRDHGPRTATYGHGTSGKIRERTASPSASCPLRGKQRTSPYTSPGTAVYADAGADPQPGDLIERVRRDLNSKSLEVPRALFA